MSRVRANIMVNGQERWTLFDSGARNTYVVADVAEGLVGWELPRPGHAAIGGEVHAIHRECALIGTIEELWVRTHARVVEMQEWGIHHPMCSNRFW